jgi:GGDEF domain-containing protein
MRIGRVREFLSSLASALPLAREQALGSIEGLEDEVALDAGFDAARSDCTELALMMLRPDGLAMLCERYGKQAANQVVRSFGGCAELCLDDPFLLFQLGDGEFCCILPGTSAEVAMSIGETIRARFAGVLTLTGAGPVFATASVGVVSSRQLGFNVDTLRSAARQSLEEASERGGNRVVPFGGDAFDQGQSAKLGVGAFRPSSRERAAALR